MSERVPVVDGGVRVGATINGKYLLERVLGEGGVGIVYAARNVELDERVALKFLKPEMLEQPDVVARFAREAKAACSIRSEYVCSVYDVGVMPSGAPFLVMECLDGQNLDTVIRDRGRFGVREGTEYMMQTCEALAVAHAKGIVHRDIKPENLFLSSHSGMQIIKVLDFGISKSALTGSIFRNNVPLVQTVNLMGSPCYMSPEQIRNAERVDARSDIWSLGMAFFEMLSGTIPFHATSITEVCAAILEQPLASILNYRDDLPTGLVAVIEKCLEKDVNRRYQNVAEVAVALMPFAPRRAVICAERASQALRAAGIIEAVRFASDFPPMITSSNGPPDRLSEPTTGMRLVVSAAPGSPDSGQLPSAPRLPSELRSSQPSVVPASGLVPVATSAAAPAHASSSPSLPATLPIDDEEPKFRSSKKTTVGVLLAGLLLGGGIFAGYRVSASHSTATTPDKPIVEAITSKPVVVPTPTTNPSPAPEAAGAAVSAAAQSTGTSTSTGSSTAAAPPGTPRFAWSPRTRAPAAPPAKATAPITPSAAPPAPPVKATKSTDEPDLGY